MNNFILRFKELIFSYGKKWDKLAASKSNLEEYVKENLNEEPEKFYNNNRLKPTFERSIAKDSGDIFNNMLYMTATHNDDYNSDELNYYIEAIRKYTTKNDIVVYRGVKEFVMQSTIKEAINKNCDLYDVAFMSTSLFKSEERIYPYYLRIYIPKGTCAYYVGDASDEGDNYEVLVQKGARLKIVSKDKVYYNCILLGTD